MKRQLAGIAVLLLSHEAIASGDEWPPLPAGTQVRIRAPKTVRIPGVFTATPGRIEWRARELVGDPSRFAATVPGLPEPIAAPRPGATVEGKIVSTDPRGLVITLATHAEVVRIPSEAVARIEVKEGRRSGNKHVVVGGLIGLGVGLAIFGTVAATCESGWDCAGYWWGALLATPCLTVAGIAVGASSDSAGHWREVWGDRVRVSLRAERNRAVGVRLAVSF